MAAKKRKEMKTTRVFNGKRYEHYTEKEWKKEMVLVAKNIRKSGDKARVTSSKYHLDGTKGKKTVYHIWVR